MALSDGKLQKFFSNQKVGVFDALKHKGKVQSPVPQSVSQETSVETDEKNPVSDSLAIHDNTVSKAIAIKKQSVSNPLEIRKQYSSNPIAIPLADLVVSPLESDTFNPNIDLQLSAYSKKEREFLDLIFWQCHNNCSLISPAISTEEIRDSLKISTERVRNLVFRIAKKGGLTSKMSKSGQNACRVFEISKPLYQNILESHKRKNLTASDPLADPLAKSTNSSSNKINITTTSENRRMLPDDWKNIDIEPLKHIGFSETQLMQLQHKNTPDIVQESIFHFAHSLENNSKSKSYSDPLNVFMGVLRKGQAWFEKDYKSPQEIAMQQLIERKKAQQEREQALKEELEKLEFEDWFSQLTAEERTKISSEFNIPAAMKHSRDIVLRGKFFEYFKRNMIKGLENRGSYVD